MQRQRDKNKSVILLGDLNIKHTASDMHWADRLIYIPSVLEEVRETKYHARQNLPQWKLDVEEHWTEIRQVMETQEVIKTKTMNSMTNETFDKFRLVVTLKNGQRVHLGKNETEKTYCTYPYRFNADSYWDEDLEERLPCREADIVSVEILSELMSKIAGVSWEETLQREIGFSHGNGSRLSPTRAWLTQIIIVDGMVDTFRHYFPKAEGRFTCWNQFTNRRYVNEGARIDYILVDKSLMDRVERGTNLRSYGFQDENNAENEALTEAAALRAATANGQYKATSFAGGGIQEASHRTLDSQFGEPHTGMIYTPPSFSDHIAVSLRLNNDDGGLLKQNLKLSTDSATRKAQPHKAQRSIAAFFPKGTTATNHVGVKKENPQASLKFSKISRKTKVTKKSTLKYHFQKQPNK